YEREEIVGEPRIDAGGEERRAAASAGVREPVAQLGEEGARVDERDDRARDDVLPRGKDAADVLQGLEGAEIRRRRVADTVGVEREEGVSVVGGAHANRREAAALAGILPGLGGARSEEHTSELQSPCNLVGRLL